MTVQEIVKNIGLRNMSVLENGQLQIPATAWAKKNWEEIKLLKPELVEAIKKNSQELADKKALEEAKRIAEMEDLKNGTRKIVLSYHDGEYLMGYEACGQAADLLKELGLCEYVSGWGMHVRSELVKDLGKEFTYQQAVEYSQPERDAKAAGIAQKEATRKANFDEAKVTRKPVELRRYSANCNDPHEECSMDIVTVWAMPDGSEKKTRAHTW